MSLALVAGAVFSVLYSAWGQELIRQYVVKTMSDGSVRVQIESFRLTFPLHLTASGVVLDMEGGEHIAARHLETSVDVLPLLTGHASLPKATLSDARISIGSPDSAMYMTVDARRMELCKASVRLKDMNIDVADGCLCGARVDLLLNPDTTAADTTPTEPTEMAIRLRRLRVDSLQYTMRMLPTIDSLGATIPSGILTEANIDLKNQKINIGAFTGSGLNVAYIVPDEATVAATPVVPETTDTASTEPWTIAIDTIGFDRARALYTTRGYKPLPGLDFSYIQADSMRLGIKDFYNRVEVVRVPLTLSATERCGVRLDASGTLDIDASGLKFDDFALKTPLGTDLKAKGFLGMGDLTTDPSTPLQLDLEGVVSVADARLMFPSFAPYMAGLYTGSVLGAAVRLGGTSGSLRVDDITLGINSMFRLSAHGLILNAFDPDHMGGDLSIDGSLINVNPIKNTILPPESASEINIPTTTFSGEATMTAGRIKGRLQAHTEQGKLSLDAYWDSRAEGYTLDLDADHFPVGAFMPTMGVGQISASLRADGRGYDPFSTSTTLHADLDVRQAAYGGYDYSGIRGTVALHQGIADLDLHSSNQNARFDLTAHGNLDGDTYTWQADISDAYIDLQALHLSETEAQVEGTITAHATVSPKAAEYSGTLTVPTLVYSDEIGSTRIAGVTADFASTPVLTTLDLRNRDLNAYVSSPTGLDTIMTRFTAVSDILTADIAARRINVDRLQQALPPFKARVQAGADNFINDILGETRSGFNSARIEASNDSSLYVGARVLGYSSPSMRLDTISAVINQYGPRLIFDARVDNRPGTFDEWAHVRLDGYLFDNSLAAHLTQHDISGREGYAVGLRAEFADSVATISLDPTDPTIAYKSWTVNEDNFIKWNFAHRHLDANLHMTTPGSSLSLYTDHVEGDDDHQEKLMLNIKDIQIADWISINPFAPPMTGLLSANMGLSEENESINGSGTVTLADFCYDRSRVGTIDLGLDVTTDLTGRIRASADMSIDGVRTVTLAGALNDSTASSPLALDLSVIHFPLTAVNPFLPKGVARLKGTLNGSLDVTGKPDALGLDGWLQFDSTEVYADMVATSYPVSSVKIPVEKNVVRFTDFGISGVNGQPLALNGSVDLHSMSNPRVDLKINASNFQLCNTSRAARGADIYGKGFVNLNASIAGNMDFMNVSAALTVLSGTNIVYVMPDAASTITQSTTSDMVRFVNFADTAAVAAADSIDSSALALNLEATLTIQNGSTIGVDLSTDGKNRVRLQPNGTLDYTMRPFSDGRLTGRLNLPSGYVKYTPPLMSEKHFELIDNSYVAFNGDLMNPTLALHAVDHLKANVTQSGQNSRVITFDVLLNVTGTLDHMNVAFDLTTDDDATVANELQSMSADQRANQAMNMLLYNIYQGPGTKADSNLSGNALYSFLTSQLNSWAANTIKGIDLSFGVDQYDRTVGGSSSTTTSYSYQVTKSLFNDRFKIVVGGNYSTDADADENFSQNLIKDISFEYFLNNARTMYVRLFRHTGYESILEGEITRTGVGFVYKRKVSRVGNIFRPFRRHKKSSDEKK